MPVGPTAGPIGGPPDAFGVQSIRLLELNTPTSHKSLYNYFSFTTHFISLILFCFIKILKFKDEN
ncbi:MAG: hypothetical protein ACXAEX_05110 [Promethearchaeota archaeon]